ncbi:MAG TPA: nucleotide pyrophosphohydrolase [Candidatus Thermoplasmatota archaeon]|nr:nucleotide pyrophosphohydrolase [Candidatus Thermoplasmatota archaeon]
MASSDLNQITQQVVAFRDARDWKKFHNAKDLAISLALESAEVLERFQWHEAQAAMDSIEKKQALADELADVLYWVALLAHEAGIDLGQAIESKLAKNALKYPIEKARGSPKKYSELG